MMLQRLNTLDASPPAGPYVHAVRHGDTLYLSGLTAFGSPAQTAPIEVQAREVFRNIRTIAELAGSGLENLIKITAFVTELDRIEQLRAALFDIYGEHLPASSLVRVNGLFAEGLKIEVEAILAVDA